MAHMEALKRNIAGLVRTGITPSSTIDEKRCLGFINMTTILNALMGLVFIAVAIHMKDPVFISAGAAICIACMCVLPLNRRGMYRAGRMLFIIAPCIYIVFCWFRFDVGGLLPLFFLGIVLDCFMVYPTGRGKTLPLLTLFIVLCYVISIFSREFKGSARVIPALDFEIIRYSLVFGNMAAVVAFGWFFSTLQGRAIEEVLEERKKSEDLLLHIFPSKIADMMKENRNASVENFSEVTVLFAEICNLDEVSAGLSHSDVIELLSDIFLIFEGLTERHGLEKIKTVGGIYMVASGVPEPREDNIEAAAELALEMMEEIRMFKAPHGARLQLRIGISTGPAIAGVIGLKRFSYDLWGNTVNMASRLTHSGIPGRVQVGAEVGERLAGRYDLERRGGVEVKGVGRMDTWFLNGIKGPPGARWKPPVEMARKSSTSSDIGKFVKSSRRSDSG